MEGAVLDITTQLTSAVDGFTAMAQNAAPVVLGAVGVLAGINLGIKLFKRFVNKVA